MKTRRTLIPLLLVTATALTACGGDDSAEQTGDTPTTAPASASASPGAVQVGVEACDLLTTDEVAAAVGSPVGEGVASSGQPITGGTFTSCQWMSADPDHPADSATLYLYSNTAAADSAREDDSQELSGLGDDAFSVTFAGVWVYVGEQSLMTQWYTFSGSDEDNLPKSEALAEAVVDKL